MFSLHSVLLIALDVVKGPYLHCHAPLNPFVPVAQEPTSSTPANTTTTTTHSRDNNKNSHEKENMICSGDSGSKRKMRHDNSCKCDASSYTTTSADRLGGFSDVFVPRSEFCRRVMYLMEAESGLLYLFYPEEIAGLHYQRKTLRYTLCFVFRVDVGLVTPSLSLTERLIQPYSVVLTGIMEELRKTEVVYGYISMGLARVTSHYPSVVLPRHFSREREPSTTMAMTMTTNDSETQPPRVDVHAASGESVAAAASVNTTGLPATVAQVTSSSVTNEDSVHTSSKGTSRVNVFLTPLQDPASLQWTPLEEMIATLYACLSREERQETPRIRRAPRKGETPGAHENGLHTTIKDEEEQQQQQEEELCQPVEERKVTVRLSQTHSYHVCRMTQPYVLRYHTLDEVPIPIVEYTAEMLEWADLAIQDVYKAVDGYRTIASIVQLLAVGHEPPGEETQKESRVLSPLSSPHPPASSLAAAAWALSPRVKNAAGCSFASPNLRATSAALPSVIGILSSTHGTETRVPSPLSQESRSGMSPVVTVSKGPTSLVTFLVPHERSADDVGIGSHEGGQHWYGELEFIVLEALQHLELHNYVRILRPCQLNSKYNTTRAFYSVVSNWKHASRRIIGQRMLLVEEEFYRLRKKQPHTQQERQPMHRRRQHESKSGVSSGFGDSPSESYALTLPAVLLAKAALDWQEKKRDEDEKEEKEEEGDTGPAHLAAVEQSPNSFYWSGVVPTPNDTANETTNELEDAPAIGMAHSESDINAAAAAALCAIGKFTNNTVANVQWEMRRIPGWSTAFASWEEMCCKALVEIALLNDWLVEVGRPPTSYS
ncbi:hypothetical protein C3747_22g69 [Trypanosoma cruzi]|uniref:CCZ1/INTU/HSP4 first Longin domain-containing protein n=2 Tax=Trypanosoma cruzi TaxID=5693 RepID=Q4CMX0_TRYCC|nr:hypothetical protein, conserved [Trypanosoma cruzi]EAN81622.1 hypothetical protein, conserved [Trypanosoma cruzi]PWV16651.1 hypothetical protein C3747_22g69 [Trypanosoma cruzi]RNC59050.1 hypothetical protein TcCL_ESM03333 [Trypanosoma cruzi]|eukprot:XP_803068.1 hypothetical protein [Trypanosoma cruzi strain CL Brener]